MPGLDDIAWMEECNDAKKDLREEEDCASGAGNPAHHLKPADQIAQNPSVTFTGKNRDPMIWAAID